MVQARQGTQKPLTTSTTPLFNILVVDDEPDITTTLKIGQDLLLFIDYTFIGLPGSEVYFIFESLARSNIYESEARSLVRIADDKVRVIDAV